MTSPNMYRMQSPISGLSERMSLVKKIKRWKPSSDLDLVNADLAWPFQKAANSIQLKISMAKELPRVIPSYSGIIFGKKISAPIFTPSAVRLRLLQKLDWQTPYAIL